MRPLVSSRLARRSGGSFDCGQVALGRLSHDAFSAVVVPSSKVVAFRL